MQLRHSTSLGETEHGYKAGREFSGYPISSEVKTKNLPRASRSSSRTERRRMTRTPKSHRLLARKNRTKRRTRMTPTRRKSRRRRARRNSRMTATKSSSGNGCRTFSSTRIWTLVLRAGWLLSPSSAWLTMSRTTASHERRLCTRTS